MDIRGHIARFRYKTKANFVTMEEEKETTLTDTAINAPKDSTVGASQDTTTGTATSAEPRRERIDRDDSWGKLTRISQYFGTFTENGVITKERFMEAIGDKHKSFLAERFFDSIDADNNQFIDFNELNQGAQRLLTGDMAERVSFIFSLYDFDGDGTISFDELRTVLTASSTESNMELSEEKLASLTETFLDELDEDGDRLINLKEMGHYWKKNPQMISAIANESVSWLLPPNTTKKVPKKRKVPLSTRIKNNATLVGFIAVIGLINVILFIVNCYNYRDSNWWIIFARGPGMCLDFDVSFVILLPLRRFITFLRMSELRKWLPLDHNIYLHMLFAGLIVFFSIFHTLAHIGNAVTVAADDYNVTVAEFIFTTKANIGWVAGSAPITGVLLVVVLSVMAVLSMPFIRRSGHFEVFFWSHKLYYAFYFLCILHATHFWKWFLAPGIIFILEIITFNWYSRGKIHEASLLPSKVIELLIKPDQRFRFTSGDYVYVCLPGITRYEWHPFTISSSPQIKNTFTLHIRAVGSWTNRLKKYIDAKGAVLSNDALNKTHVPTDGESVRLLSLPNDEFKIETASENGNETNLQIMGPATIRKSVRRRAVTKITYDDILISGPFGTPCREIFETSHPILIGAGIGVTPFASILQSIFYHTKKAAATCPKCRHHWFNWQSKGKPIVDKVDFVWINRDSKSFEWFAELLFQLEQEFAVLDMKNVFTMHLYMTGAHKIQELRGVAIQVALDVNYKKTKTDCLTGLSTKTRAGRPNFDQLFKEISESSPYKKKVFLCGSPMLAKDVRFHCQKYGIKFSKEHF